MNIVEASTDFTSFLSSLNWGRNNPLTSFSQPHNHGLPFGPGFFLGFFTNIKNLKSLRFLKMYHPFLSFLQTLQAVNVPQINAVRYIRCCWGLLYFVTVTMHEMKGWFFYPSPRSSIFYLSFYFIVHHYWYLKIVVK